jgi:predicted PurR-regulated permease PerM
MQFKLSTAVLATLIGVAISGPLVVRDTATILGDLSTIKTDINTLTQHFNEFTGDLLQALAAQAVEQQLESDIDKATSDTKATSALSAADSTSVTNALLGLKPDIVTSLNAIVAKVPFSPPFPMLYQTD